MAIHRVRFNNGLSQGSQDGSKNFPYDRWSNLISIATINDGDEIHVQSGNNRYDSLFLSGIADLTVKATMETMGSSDQFVPPSRAVPKTYGDTFFASETWTEAALDSGLFDSSGDPILVDCWGTPQTELCSIYINDRQVIMYDNEVEMIADLRGGWWDSVNDIIYVNPNWASNMNNVSNVGKVDSTIARDQSMLFTECPGLILQGQGIMHGYRSSLDILDCENALVEFNLIMGGGVADDNVLGIAGQAFSCSGPQPSQSTNPTPGIIIRNNGMRDAVNGTLEISNLIGAQIYRNVMQDSGQGIELWGFNENCHFHNNTVKGIYGGLGLGHGQGNSLWIKETDGPTPDSGSNINNLFENETYINSRFATIQIGDGNEGNKIKRSLLVSFAQTFVIEDTSVSNPVIADGNLVVSSFGGNLVEVPVGGTFEDEDNWYTTTGNKTVFSYQGTTFTNEVPEISFDAYQTASGALGGAGQPVGGDYGVGSEVAESSNLLSISQSISKSVSN